MQLDLAAALKKRKMSAYRLAKETGLAKSTIGRIQRGRVRPLHATVELLEKALRVDLVFPVTR